MRKIRLLCIPPYEGMYNLMMNIAAQREDVELIVHMGNLEDGLKAVLRNKDNNIDAIISRGGTAKTIQEHCDIPCYSIVPSAYDILRTIRLAQGLSELFAVVGFPEIAKYAEALRDIMQYDFPVVTVQSAEECYASLQAIKETGVQTIVGDTISVRVSHELGMHGLLIVSGLESIEDAIDSTIKMYRYYEATRGKADLLSQLLKQQKYETIIFTSDGQLYFSTQQDLPDNLMQLMQKMVPYVLTRKYVKNIKRYEKYIVSLEGALQRSNGEDYCVFSLSKVATGAILDRYMIQTLTADSELPEANPIEFYLGRGEEIMAVQGLCERYANMASPVLLMGEPGTGKDCFAHYMYSRSKLNYSSFIIIDASLLNGKAWDFLLASDNSPLTDTGLTIYFKHMESMEPAWQKQLIAYLKNSQLIGYNRLFFAYTTGYQNEPQDALYLYLMESLHCLRLQIPPLSQRRNDIPGLVGMFINAINVQCGTRVIGMTQEAMLILQNHDWPRNVDQLLRVVRTLVIDAKSLYISVEQVRMLTRNTVCSGRALCDNAVDLSKPLDEITSEIVRRVYEQENMNQTQAAKRLGISRSTLWRMLKRQ